MTSEPSPDPIQSLFKQPEVWVKVAQKLRELFGARFTHREIQQKLGLSQPTVWRFMNGDPTRRAFQQQSLQLAALLREMGIPLSDLQGEFASAHRWLCIDRIETESRSSTSVIECPSLMFRVAGDHAEAIPTDPRSRRADRYCRYCGTQLSSHCPYCRNASVVAGSHCPACGENYVAGVPQELRGLIGQDLTRACDKRNQANRQAREYADAKPLD